MIVDVFFYLHLKNPPRKAYLDSLLGLNGSFASTLGHQPGICDFNLMTDRLDHIVDGKGSDGGTHQGLHLYPRLVSDPTGTFNENGRPMHLNVHHHLIQWQGMAQGDQITGFSIHPSAKEKDAQQFHRV